MIFVFGFYALLLTAPTLYPGWSLGTVSIANGRNDGMWLLRQMVTDIVALPRSRLVTHSGGSHPSLCEEGCGQDPWPLGSSQWGTEASCQRSHGQTVLEGILRPQSSFRIIASDNLTANSWESLSQTARTRCSKIPIPSKLWKNASLVFEPAKFPNNLLCSYSSLR